MNKKLLMQICQGQHERVERNIENQIEKLNKMKLLSKVVSFVDAFSSHLTDDEFPRDLSKHYGKKLVFSFGYETNRYPQSSSIFYTFDGRRNSFSIEDGREFLNLLELADERKFGMDGEIVIDPGFQPRLIALILGDEIMEKYLNASMEMSF